MGPCIECNQYHPAENECEGYKCLRCGSASDGNDKRDGCRGPNCQCQRPVPGDLTP